MATDFLNLGIIPKANLEYWHALDGLTEVDFVSDSAIVPDYSGNGRDLTLDVSAVPPALDSTVYKANLFDKRPVLYFDGASSDPFKNSAAIVSIKHVFMLVKFDGAAFAGNEGLLSDTNAINVLAGGGAASTIFFNFSFANYTYFYNFAAKAQSNQTAPINVWALVEIQKTDGFPMQGWQIGRQLGGATARWKGWWAENLGFSEVLSETDRQKVYLYFALKFGTQNLGQNPLYFPSDDFLPFRRSRFFAEPPDYRRITDSFEFEDGGMTFNESAGGAARRWEYDYLSRTPAQAAIFDEFFNQARFAGKFLFLDKYGETHTNVQIESYNRSHEAHKSWKNDCKFVLVKYP